MRKNKLFLTVMLVLTGTCVAQAQKALQQSSERAYTYVQQDGTKIDKLGTAAFTLSISSHPTVEFDANGKAVMTIGGNKVAVLPTSDNGQLVVEFETAVAEANLNKVSKTVTDAGYATLYSPFQLAVPTEAVVEAYAPNYDAESHKLKCTDATKIAEGSVIPCETALLLKNAGTVVYTISADASTVTKASALTGSSLKIAKPEVASGETLYTLGHEKTDASKYGFFSYNGSYLNPGLAWLVAGTVSSSDARNFVTFSFDDEEEDDATALDDLQSDDLPRTTERKYIENGRVVILKGGKKYNVAGQTIR